MTQVAVAASPRNGGDDAADVILKVTGLKKSYGSLSVIKGVDLDLHRGEVLAIIGPSGSGKSTLIRCLNLLEIPSEGVIAYNGRRVDNRFQSRGNRIGCGELRRHVGMVFQHFNLFPHKTVMQNVCEGPITVLKEPREEVEARIKSESDVSYDYVIVGAGPSGCVTAARLVADYGARVLLLEEGPWNNHPLLRMPAGFIKMLGKSKYLSFYQTAPQPQLDGRVHEVPQGRVLGGGSSVNAMVYMRGRPSDYARWNEAIKGDAGPALWGWNDILPHYVRQENNQSLAGPAHGTTGPLHVSDAANVCEMSDIFVKTLQTMGVPLRQDFNAGTQFGVGYMQITTHHARRCGAVEAYLAPVLDNPLLTVRTGVKVTRLILENGRAVGVECERRGVRERLLAEAEIIVTAGAFGTPKLLMLSGLGPAEHLREHDIAVVADLPGVGQNLMDHHEVPIVAASNGRYGYFGEDRGWPMLRNGLQYLLTRTGPVASNGCETCAFINPLAPADEPTLQLYCVPTVYLDRDVMGVPATDGVTLNSCLLQPNSRGSVRLRSADPRDTPMINSNYLGHAEDIRQELAGLRFAREVLAAAPMVRVVSGELFPGNGQVSDDELLAHCKRTVKTNYHPCGTCRMGADKDSFAVLTADLRVRGIDGLRVFDVSMMPNITSGNTNAPAMAVADRAVDLMMAAS